MRFHGVLALQQAGLVVSVGSGSVATLDPQQVTIAMPHGTPPTHLTPF